MTDNTEHPFAQYVRILGKGKKGSRSLSQQEARDAFAMILRGEVEDVQIGAFLMLLRVKEESPEEIAGFVQACRDTIAAPAGLQADVDWSSYAGKRKHLPWFIASLLLLNDAGYRVFIHGAKGHTAGRLYTEDAFLALGLPIASNWQQAAQQLDRHKLCFMPVEAMSPVLYRLINLRNLLGLRSPVHTLCRLINPLNAQYGFSSIFHPAYADTHQQAAVLLQQPNMAVFKGEGGEIERKPNATCLVKSVNNGITDEEKWPRLQEEQAEAEEVLDMQIFKAVWRGESRHEYGEQAIIGTLAIALKQLQQPAERQHAEQLANNLWQQRDRTRFD